MKRFFTVYHCSRTPPPHRFHTRTHEKPITLSLLALISLNPNTLAATKTPAAQTTVEFWHTFGDSGKAMMTINSTAGLGNLLDAAEQNTFSMGVGVLPILDGSKRNGVVIGGASLWVAKGASKPEAETALDFALYLTNTANMASWHKLTGYYPVSSSVDLLRKQGWFSSSPLQIVTFKSSRGCTFWKTPARRGWARGWASTCSTAP